jgi:O-antigen ligase
MRQFNEGDFRESISLIYFAVVLISVTGAVALNSFVPLAVPLLILLVVFSVTQFEKLFLLLFLTIPLSSEFSVTDSLGTDMPAEPIMWILFGFYLLLWAHSEKVRNSTVFRHPLFALIALHLGWIFIAFIYSDHHIISLKFFLSKLWYTGVFFLLSYYLLKTRRDFNRIMTAVFVSLLFTAIVVFIRHAIEGGFTFASINSVVNPFYRNKVSYSSLIALFLPILWYLYTEARRNSSWRTFVGLSVVFLLVALYFGYTRAAMISVVAAAFTPLLLRHRLIKPILVVGVLGAGFLSWYMFSGDTYLEHAPDYDRTIMHQRFDNLLEATYQFEDISTMERFYRWIAGYYMVLEKPVTGFGPNSFYHSYEPYTVRSFQTYVSDNPEQSGIHNYYLMLMVEQGLPGFLFFFAIVVFFLVRAQWLYEKLDPGPDRNLLVAITASMIVILLLQLMNDLIEVDKVGTFFWLWLAVLIKIEWDWKQ